MIHTLPLSIVIDELQRVRQNPPLVHCLTNEVVQNFTANVLLALGISPAMVVAQQEVAEFVDLADALLINIGTLYAERAPAMQAAVLHAEQTHTPWVLDPVAVGVLTYRTEFALELCNHRPSVIRGNASEILALAGHHSSGQGADSGDSSVLALPAAQELARRYHTIVIVTGAVDYITDGQKTWSTPWDVPMLSKITGSGCALSAIVAGFLANSTEPLNSAASACAVMVLAAQAAMPLSQGPGSLKMHLVDALYQAPQNLFNINSLLMEEHDVC